MNGSLNDNNSHHPIHITKKPVDAIELFRQKSDSGYENDEPLYLCNISDVIQKQTTWKQNMPRVIPFYGKALAHNFINDNRNAKIESSRQEDIYNAVFEKEHLEVWFRFRYRVYSFHGLFRFSMLRASLGRNSRCIFQTYISRYAFALTNLTSYFYFRSECN